jgi:hypothetical protein
LALIGFPRLLRALKAKESQGGEAESQGSTLAFIGFETGTRLTKPTIA